MKWANSQQTIPLTGSGDCSNRNASTAYEPGSTLMSYAIAIAIVITYNLFDLL